MLVAGVDVSGRTTGVTAIAWLQGKREPALERVLAGTQLRGDHGDAEVVRELVSMRPSVVALDAPLALPHAVTCTNVDCSHCLSEGASAPSYGSRRCDSKEAWAEAGHAEKPPMPTVMVAGIAFRGMYLKRLIERERIAVIETWPMAIYRALDGPEEPSDTNEAWRRTLLASKIGQLSVRLAQGPGARDRLDAVAAAYAAWAHESGFGHPIEGLEGEGSIWTLRRS